MMYVNVKLFMIYVDAKLFIMYVDSKLFMMYVNAKLFVMQDMRVKKVILYEEYLIVICMSSLINQG